jgi:hypothetical protein
MRFVAWFVFIVLLFAGVYWYKCTQGIDFFPFFSLSKYLPEVIRKEVRPNMIFADETGVLFQDNFDRPDSLKNWVEVPKKKNEGFSYSLGVDDFNHTPCLSVVNWRKGRWSLQEHQLIEVKEGDKIGFDGSVLIPSVLPHSGLGVILFDKNYHVVTVDFAVPDQLLGALWKHVFFQFRVPKGVSFLRFILTGYGQESVLFDDVKIWRENR